MSSDIADNNGRKVGCVWVCVGVCWLGVRTQKTNEKCRPIKRAEKCLGGVVGVGRARNDEIEGAEAE